MNDFYKILQCPITGEDLILLDEVEIEKLNKKVDDNKLFAVDGSPVQHKIDKALITEKGAYIYPVINGIFFLLKDTAISAKENAAIAHVSKSAGKKIVQSFYNGIGWDADESGVFQDAHIYEDLRDVAKDYFRQSNLRVKRYLKPEGKFLVDVASGPVQFDEYLTYHEKYEKRVCVDFSIKALQQARKKLGDKGIYVLGDITNLPFKENAFDAIISLHTIYHVPKEEQLNAFNEIYRILKPNAKAVIVYSWGRHSVLMNFFLFFYKAINKIISKTPLVKKLIKNSSYSTGLYFHAYPASWLKKNLKFNYKIYPWRSVSVPFTKIYIHKKLGGKKILDLIYRMEEKYPKVTGAIGEYPLIVIDK